MLLELFYLYESADIFATYIKLSSPSSWSFLLIFLVLLFIYVIIVLILFHIFFLTISMAVLTLLSFSIRLKQIDHFVLQIKPNLFNSLHLKRFFKMNVKSLMFLEDCSKIYGTALFYELLITLPFSAIFTMVIIFNRLKPIMIATFGASIFLATFLAFIIHYCTVKISFEFNKPVKKIIKIWLASEKINGKKTLIKIKLFRYVEEFHSVKPYTLKYGQFGSVTFKSFKMVWKT